MGTDLKEHAALKQPPFTVPDGYFEAFSVRHLSLPEAWKQPVYTVPAQYFDTLPERIAERIGHAELPKIITWGALRTQVAFAASFLLLVFIGHSLLAPVPKQPATLAEDPLLEVISDQIDMHSLMQVVTEETENTVPAALNSEAVIHYLSHSGLSYHDIATSLY